jgi:hypothetical protein
MDVRLVGVDLVLLVAFCCLLWRVWKLSRAVEMLELVIDQLTSKERTRSREAIDEIARCVQAGLRRSRGKRA